MSITEELLAPSGPILKFSTEGDAHKIVVESIDKVPVNDIATGQPQTWPNGDIRYQYVISGPSETYADDPGATVRLFIKGYGVEALREALRAADVRGDDDIIGGTLGIKWASTDEPSRPGYNGAKRFQAQFKKSEKTAIVGDLI